MPTSATRPARPRTKPPDVRRQELMNAAQRIFLRRGIAATSVDQIVAAADVAKGTFYLHFDSKEALLQALQGRFVADLDGALRAALAGGRAGDWRGRLRAWIRAGVDGYLDQAALHHLVFHAFRPEASPKRHENPSITELAVFLAAGTRAGAWSVETPRLTASMMSHALHGLLDEVGGGPKRTDRGQLVQALAAFFERGLGP